MSRNLKVSVITVSFNAENCIEATIQSVLAQNYPDIEYIIIDGASNDGTMAIVNKYHPKISKIISEKDNGIYDAMNKGINLATGDIIYFLNADDRFYDNRVIADIADEFDRTNETDVVCGKTQLVNAPPGFTLPARHSMETIFSQKREIILTQICHQRIFCKKRVFDKTGLFDTQYRIFADYDWFLKVYTRGIAVRYIPRYVAFYNFQGRSQRAGYSALHEKLRIILKNSFWDFIVYTWDKFCAVLSGLLRL
ncbi:MAG TPA: glycosyltransferase family 2 protein [Candidatus Omnitrophota bacterium]|nr:glycosyltransferase family 2 protein [Candidatus Omnitrophota bacterium]HPD85243.1 glycosyltransferase family 2 protein [Candidatus Omnitrophota bacterium]HRZ04256.1 glycosyltransferase family 2 protein [Candidatus Omnitrophota bacterium]